MFYAAKWHVFSRQDANVNSHHAVFQGFGHAVNAPYIAAVKITGEAKLGVVGGVNRFLLGVKLKHRRKGPEGLFLGAKHVSSGISNHGGLKKLTAAELV